MSHESDYSAVYDGLNENYLRPPYGDFTLTKRLTQHWRHMPPPLFNSYVGGMPCMPAVGNCTPGAVISCIVRWGRWNPLMIPCRNCEAGIYTHLISDHLHYWEKTAAVTTANRYSSRDVVRGQEGDHWKASVGEPPIPEKATARS